MNKIYRKVADFGILPRYKNIPLDVLTDTAKKMIKANLPLCLIDLREKDALLKLREVGFKADVFLAAENPQSLEEAYEAAGNGAQFFITDSFDPELLQKIKNSGLYCIPRISTREEALKAEEMNLEAVLTGDKELLKGCNLQAVLSEPDHNIKELTDSAFIISDYRADMEPGLYVNNAIQEMLNLNYTEVFLNSEASPEERESAEVFAATHKIPLTESEESYLLLKTTDMNRALKYFKWKTMYINPNTAVMEGQNVQCAFFDRKIAGMTIKISI